MKIKRKSTEKQTRNLHLRLRENILTTNPLVITNKATNKNTIQNIQFKTNESQSKSPSHFSPPNTTRKKLFSLSLLKYKPQRLVQFKGINIPLPSLGKASFDYSKTFNTEKTIDTNKNKTLVVFDSSKKNVMQNKNKEFDNIINNENIIEFKNRYILKFAEYSDSFSKIYQLNDIIDDTRKIEFKELFGKISKSLELQSQLLLDDIDAEFKSNRGNNINNMFINPYSTATTSSSISRDALFNNKQENKINEKIKQIIFLISDYNNYMIKFLHLLNKEIKENKRNYMKLLKTNYDYELKINSQTKKLDDIKKDFEKYNISKKIRGEKVKENTIKNIKSQFLKKENEYLMHNFQLKDEIYSLVKLLDKNKGYFNKYKEAKKEINDNKKNVNLLRIEFNKELQDKNLEYALEKDQKEELIIKLEELEETIRELKEENDNNKRKEIETNAQILQLKIILGQKNENLKMMNEELEQYIREYEKEKHNNQNSQNSLRALENRIYNEEKQKEKESISNNNEFPI